MAAGGLSHPGISAGAGSQAQYMAEGGLSHPCISAGACSQARYGPCIVVDPENIFLWTRIREANKL
jgi:hypothetical protein